MKQLTTARKRRDGTVREDARVIRSKRDLANALEELLTEKNFDDITIKEISEKAMVSKLTFYNNFLDKKDLLMYVFHRYYEEIHEILIPLKEEEMSPHRKVIEVIKRIVKYIIDRPLSIHKMIQNDTSRTVYWSLTKFIEQTTEKMSDVYGRLLGIRVPPDILAYYYAGAFTNLIYHLALKSEEKPDVDTLVNYIVLLTNPGEATPSSRVDLQQVRLG